MSIRAFVDPGIRDSHNFCIHLLQSSDFLSSTISKYAKFGDNKDSRAINVAERIRNGEIKEEDLLLSYCKQPRQWFSYKIGEYENIPNLEDPKILLHEFGKEAWYGPISCDEDLEEYFIRTFKFKYFSEDGDKNILISHIRWPLIVKITDEYISFYWNGFSTNQRDKINTHSQFQFWNYIPNAIGELENNLESEYEYPIVYKLILKEVWNRYIKNPNYKWRHLAVRAEASGVNLNARSKGVKEINVEGLLSLAKEISKAVIYNLFSEKSVQNRNRMIKKAETSVLQTLIHNWGTKSYEFSLDKEDEKLFKAHCYFGLKPNSQTQDCFPHFKSFQSYGGSSMALDFLLEQSEDML